jgi:Tfp pilus assembly protein PilZ
MIGMSAATNRRRHPRVRPKQLATRVRSGDDLHIGLGIENISMGGAFVRCNTPMKVGRAVTLEVMRAGASQLLEIDGTITSSVTMAAAAAAHRSAGMGISFDRLPPSVALRLEGLIVSIDPSAMQQPPAKRAAKAPVLQEGTELMPRHVPDESFIGSQTFVPTRKPALRPPVEGKTDMALEQMRRELLEKEELIAELQTENKKLRQRLLNLVNHG